MHDWILSLIAVAVPTDNSGPAGFDINNLITGLLLFAGVVVSSGLVYLSTRVRRTTGPGTSVETRDERLAAQRLEELERNTVTLDLLRDAVRRRGGDPYEWVEAERNRPAAP